MWQGAIDDGADWISIVIWNDYNEDSALMPGRWPFGSERYLFSRDESYLARHRLRQRLVQDGPAAGDHAGQAAS